MNQMVDGSSHNFQRLLCKQTASNKHKEENKMDAKNVVTETAEAVDLLKLKLES